MKKVCKSMLVVFMAMFMILATAACGGGSSAPSIVGTWKAQFDSSKLPEEMKSQASMYEALMSAMDITLVFSDDGKVNISMSAMGQSSSAEGTYTFDGTTVKVADPTGTLNNQTSAASGETSKEPEMKLVDGKLVIEGSEYMPFVKQ